MFRLDGLGTRIADLCIGRDISKRSITSRLAILRMPGRTTARVWRSRLSKLREYCNAIAVPGCRVTSVTEVRARQAVTVGTENLDSDVAVMKSAKDRI